MALQERSQLQSLWAQHVLFGRPFSEEEVRKTADLSDPIQAVLAFLLFKRLGKEDVFNPSFTRLKQLSVTELCQLSLLYAMVGEKGKLWARQLLKFSKFPTLRSLSDQTEREDPSLSLLQEAFGKRGVSSEELSPYFAALHQELPAFGTISEESTPDILFDDTILTPEDNPPSRTSSLQIAFVTEGEKMPLGSLVAGAIEVPIFGLQGSPLSDPSRFGIDRLIPDRRWGRVSCQKEAWFEVKNIAPEGFDLHFYGSKSDNPLFFVFYVRAEKALIGDTTYLPKTLDRYTGPALPVSFSSQDSTLCVNAAHPSRMELIPLAGGDCFWGAHFLLAFACQEKVSLQLSCLSCEFTGGRG